MPAYRNQHLTFTFTGVAEALPGIIGTNLIWRISMQPDAANTHFFYTGGKGLTASDYGTAVPPWTSATVPTPPREIEGFEDGKVDVTDFYVLGTVGEKVHIEMLTFI